MALTIDVIDKCGAILAVYIAAKKFYPPFITNKTKCFDFKSGCVVLVDKTFKRRLVHSFAVLIMA